MSPRVHSLLCLAGPSSQQIAVSEPGKGSTVFNCGAQPSRATNSREITSVL